MGGAGGKLPGGDFIGGRFLCLGLLLTDVRTARHQAFYTNQMNGQKW